MLTAESEATMTWLNEWVKELILIILVAAFTDLLLPSHALQRYVRTVIGLFLLLVLLSPLYELFQHRWNPNQWMQAALGDPTSQEVDMQPLSAIIQQSSELKAANEKQAKQLLEQQLQASMKEGIESGNKVTVEKLEVSTKFDGSGKPSIDQVYVVLAQETEKAKPIVELNQKNEPFIAAMKPIEPVVIDDVQTKKNTSSEADLQVTEESVDARQELIKQFIAREWQIETDRIHIQSK
jgi:stage III sporulation protein AF